MGCLKIISIHWQWLLYLNLTKQNPNQTEYQPLKKQIQSSNKFMNELRKHLKAYRHFIHFFVIFEFIMQFSS